MDCDQGSSQSSEIDIVCISDSLKELSLLNGKSVILSVK